MSQFQRKDFIKREHGEFVFQIYGLNTHPRYDLKTNITILVKNVKSEKSQRYIDCLGFIVPLENFSLIWRRHHYR